MTVLRDKVCNMIKDYIRNTAAAIAIAFAVMAPVIVGSAGMALDYAQAYLVQQRLAQAIDAAALAAAAASTDAGEIEQRVQDFFDRIIGPDFVKIPQEMRHQPALLCCLYAVDVARTEEGQVVNSLRF